MLVSMCVGTISPVAGWWIFGVVSLGGMLFFLGCLVSTISYFYGVAYAWPAWGILAYAVYIYLDSFFIAPMKSLVAKRHGG